MKLDANILYELHHQAADAAYQAGRFILRYMHKKITPKHKLSGNSLASQVVTEVDFQSQDIILKTLLPTCEKFDLGFLTEECVDSSSRLHKDFFWCIDPLDGTLPFVEAMPGFSVSIALVSKSGEPQIGVVYDPLEDTLYSTMKGKGVLRNGKPWQPSFGSLGKDRQIKVYIDRSLVQNQLLFNRITEELERFVLENGLSRFEFIKHGGAVMNACWVLENHPACYFKFPKKETGGGCLWDFAATSCLFIECGAVVSDIYGNPLDLNRVESSYMNHKGVLYASNREIAKWIMDLYKRI
ncbi:MAG: inositol monophosphatase [Clostridia bacterium]|nr:inositol monophosphatase [Clostridia bacterium]